MASLRSPSDRTAPADALVEQVLAARLPSPAIRREIRETAGLSYRRMAEALEVDSMTVWRWEKGRTTPKLEDAGRYRSLLDALAEVAK